MMTSLSYDVIYCLKGKTLVTAESCTGGGIGAALTAIPSSSDVYKGGIISYTNWMKENLLNVNAELLKACGAVSSEVAKAMAEGARNALQADVAVSVTGLAGPGGDEFGNPVGTVFIGYSDCNRTESIACYFTGDREEIRNQAVQAALKIILDYNT